MDVINRQGLRFFSWIPFGIALLLVVGNFFPNLPIWGFDFHILGLPFHGDGELLANVVTLIISLFPVVKQKKGIHHIGYLILVVSVLAFLAFRFYGEIAAWASGAEALRPKTGGVFQLLEVKVLTYLLLIAYLASSLRFVTIKQPSNREQSDHDFPVSK